MIRFFFVKHFLTNSPQNCGNKLAPAGGVKLLCRQTASCSGVLEHLSFMISDCSLTLSQSAATTFRALISEFAVLHYSNIVTTKESTQKLSPGQLDYPALA
jgi:hypothetical protein